MIAVTTGQATRVFGCFNLTIKYSTRTHLHAIVCLAPTAGYRPRRVISLSYTPTAMVQRRHFFALQNVTDAALRAPSVHRFRVDRKITSGWQYRMHLEREHFCLEGKKNDLRKIKK
jgi:hypothetical protein